MTRYRFLFWLLLAPMYLAAQDHLLISEFVVTPTAGEFVEIHNPTGAAIDLSDYYLTDATSASNGAYYYNIVTGSNAGGGGFSDFHARFPAGATIPAGGTQTIAMNGTDFQSTYGVAPTYELFDTNGGIPDMREAFSGSINGQGGLTNSGEVVILYFWDGQSDLVQDVDYAVYGDKDEAVDKSGVSIDGPDGDGTASTYLNDTPISAQIALTSGQPHDIGESIQRSSLVEINETASGGNGITGNDETSENLAGAFTAGTPSPNTVPGGASGPVVTNLANDPAAPTSSDPVTISADISDDGTVVDAVVRYQVGGGAIDSVSMNNTVGDTWEGTIPAQSDGSTVSYSVRATDDEGLTGTAGPLTYTVQDQIVITPIADIQANPGNYTTVTIEGVVVIGAGVIDAQRSRIYVQDGSGRGILIFDNAAPGDLPPGLYERFNRVRVTGTVDEFSGVTEIINFTGQLIDTNQPLPDPLVLTTSGAGDVSLEGTYIQTAGTIQDIVPNLGGGTNIDLDDGSGTVVIRVWDDTGIDQSNFSIGEEMTVDGVVGVFNSAAQITPGYSDEVREGGGTPGDGAGTASVDPDSVGLGDSATLTFTIGGESGFTLETVELDIPGDWSWGGGTGNVSLDGAGFFGASVNVSGNTISISGAAITETDGGQMIVSALTAPGSATVSTFPVRTAVSGGTPTAIASSPRVRVGGSGVVITPIADIQANPGAYTTVTVEGIVTVGSGTTITTRTDAYLQDGSGRGINIFSFDGPTTPPNDLLVRGNRLQITGTVEEFSGVTEITNYSITLLSTGNPVPDGLAQTTGQAGTNTALEGTRIAVSGTATDVVTFSDATNITVDDGSGGALVRVWASTGVDVSGIAVGDEVTVEAVMDLFQNTPQLIPAHPDDIAESGGTPGDGSGVATITPDSVGTSQSVQAVVSVTGESPYTIASLSVTVPSSWSWSNAAGDVQLSGAGLSGASLSVASGVITITGAAITASAPGDIAIANLTSPGSSTVSTFAVRTAVSGGTLSAIAASPIVRVGSGPAITSIADIQANPGAFGTVTVEGIVTVASGTTITSRTDAYLQDGSGRGINIFSFDGPTTPPNDLLVRGNRLRITGTVEEFQGVTEITNYSITLISTGNALPAGLDQSTGQAGTNTALEGTRIAVSGTATDVVTFSDATNITVDDGSGEVTVRVWASTGVDVSGIVTGDEVRVAAVMDLFQNTPQLIPAHPDDIAEIVANPGDGSGTATVTPDSVGTAQTTTLTVTVSGAGGFTLETVQVDVPAGWTWSDDLADVTLSGTGFAGASAAIASGRITISGAAVTASASGSVAIADLTSPASDALSTIPVRTAVAGGTPAAIAQPPQVIVGEGGPDVTPIADIQANPGAFGTVTVEGIVTVGAGTIITTRTDTYLQDGSGRGINIFSFDGPTTPPNNLLQRGSRLRITGTVEEFQGVTEITNYSITPVSTGNPLPAPLILSTGAAGSDATLEGTRIQVTGVAIDVAAFGDATNLTVDDGSGEVTVRVWASTGINLSFIEEGDTVVVTAAMDLFNNVPQLIPADAEDITLFGQDVVVGDGTGRVMLDSTAVAAGRDNITLNATVLADADTIRTVELTVPWNWGWSGQESAVTLSGSGFADAALAISETEGAYTLAISDAFLTASDSGFVAITGLGSPLDSVYSYFWVKTAVADGTPAFIAESPRVAVGSNPIWLMRDIQTNPAQFGDPVTLRGVVTIGDSLLRVDRVDAYFQDGSGYGINISESGVPTGRFVRGDLVEITGTVSEFGGGTQIDPAASGVTVLAEGAALPEAPALSTAEAFSARWDGTFIQVSGVIVEKFSTNPSSAQPDYNLVINDGSGEITARVWGTTRINLDTLNVNDAVIISGVGDVFIDRDGEFLYQIVPAYQSDLRLDPTYQPSLASVGLTLPPHPFAPDLGEVMSIAYNAGAVNNRVTIRLFDLGGRLITTLLDENATLVQNTLEWDGRDQFRERVPLGTYICHLEVVEPGTGERKVKMAPVVVATVLSR